MGAQVVNATPQSPQPGGVVITKRNCLQIARGLCAFGGNLVFKFITFVFCFL